MNNEKLIKQVVELSLEVVLEASSLVDELSERLYKVGCALSAIPVMIADDKIRKSKNTEEEAGAEEHAE